MGVARLVLILLALGYCVSASFRACRESGPTAVKKRPERSKRCLSLRSSAIWSTAFFTGCRPAASSSLRHLALRAITNCGPPSSPGLRQPHPRPEQLRRIAELPVCPGRLCVRQHVGVTGSPGPRNDGNRPGTSFSDRRCTGRAVPLQNSVQYNRGRSKQRHSELDDCCGPPIGSPRRRLSALPPPSGMTVTFTVNSNATGIGVGSAQRLDRVLQ